MLEELGTKLEKLYGIARVHTAISSLIQHSAKKEEWTTVLKRLNDTLRYGSCKSLISRLIQNLNSSCCTEEDNSVESPTAQSFRKSEEQELAMAQEIIQNDVLLILHNLVKHPVSWDICIEKELNRIKGDDSWTYILLSHQIPLQNHFISLKGLLEHRTHFVIIDLSSSYLGDNHVSELLKMLANERHLRLLLLDFNEITSDILPLFETLLTPENAQRCAITSFPSLRSLSLTGNPISMHLESLRNVWKARVSFMKRPHAPLSSAIDNSISCGRIELHSIRVLVLEGCGMEAYLHALALRNSGSGGSYGYEELWSRTNVFCAASFGTIVSAAMALKIPVKCIEECFISIAQRVFDVSGLYVPFRDISKWWNGNNYYYYVNELDYVLRELFGTSSEMTLTEIERATGKHLIFFLAPYTDSCNQGFDSNLFFKQKFIPIRSWSSGVQGERINSIWRRCSLVKILLACCCSPGMIGPLVQLEGMTVRDAFTVPVPQLLCECLEGTSGTCSIHFEFWLPRERESSVDGSSYTQSLLCNPLIFQEVITSTESNSPLIYFPPSSMLTVKRRQSMEWLASVTGNEGRNACLDVANISQLNYSVRLLFKPTRHEVVRYNESDMLLLKETLPDALSVHSMQFGTAGTVTS
ncbi:hypothetical protein LSM04_000649 [Trypanosoma melophagium]|uniref:uncharacterized protein n=1 Tax=Trypanosoma melophagium TaxID=715481 RepID=UPI00351A32DC|nr:hypothetical protein LSM04_000649 [Trypanosoma melophagium]